MQLSDKLLAWMAKMKWQKMDVELKTASVHAHHLQQQILSDFLKP